MPLVTEDGCGVVCTSCVAGPFFLKLDQGPLSALFCFILRFFQATNSSLHLEAIFFWKLGIVPQINKSRSKPVSQLRDFRRRGLCWPPPLKSSGNACNSHWVTFSAPDPLGSAFWTWTPGFGRSPVCLRLSLFFHQCWPARSFKLDFKVKGFQQGFWIKLPS